MYSKRYKKINITDYDKMYQNEQSEKENKELKDVLRYFITKGNTVLDLGCGTQLVKKLIRGVGARYTGVDLERWDNRIVTIADAYKYIRDTDNDYNVITSTFAIDYMNPFVILKAIKKCKILIFTTYNKPWLKGSVSLYTNRKWYYIRNHIFRRIVRSIILFFIRDRIWTEKDLTGDKYYKLYVIRGKLND